MSSTPIRVRLLQLSKADVYLQHPLPIRVTPPARLHPDPLHLLHGCQKLQTIGQAVQ